RRDQIDFSGCYTHVNMIEIIQFIVQDEILQYNFDYILAVVCNVNKKIVLKPDEFGLDTQDTCEHRVKRTHPNIFRFSTYYSQDALTHLFSRFVGKGQHQNIKGIYPFADEVCYSISYYTCLSRPRTCYDHHRTFGLFNGTALRGV